MAADGSNSPAWLFSFVDLAFLLLIAMTQLAADSGPDFGEVVVPRIRAEATEDLGLRAETRWQLRVHPRVESAALPFELVGARDGDGDGAATARIAANTLRSRLAELRAAGVVKPMLAPHADSRSQDLLDAVAALDERWPARRRATVARVIGES